MQYRAAFSLETQLFIHESEENSVEIIVDEYGSSLEEYLNSFLPVFYTSNFGSFQGGSFFPPVDSDVVPFDLNYFETVNWAQNNADIHLEFGDETEEGKSIHEFMRRRLVDSEANFVFYDHGSGEMADFVTFASQEDQIRIVFYHCKSSSGSEPSERVTDAYEVCGQAAKCVRWAKPSLVLDSIISRLNRASGLSRFEKGDLDGLRLLLGPSSRRRFVFEIVIVQPGFSRAELTDRVGSLLAAADGFIYESGPFTRLRVIVP
jgi:hypothetical protein